jgi:class 3 adenylate cyclase
MRDELKAHADAVRIEHGLNFSVHIGINSGEVVVGRIADDLRMGAPLQAARLRSETGT